MKEVGRRPELREMHHRAAVQRWASPEAHTQHSERLRQSWKAKWVIPPTPATTDLIYFAGLFDGEGYVSRKGRLRLSIGMQSEVVKQFADAFGLNVHIVTPGKKAGKRNFWSFETSGSRAAYILPLLLPYLRVKQAAARAALVNFAAS